MKVFNKIEHDSRHSVVFHDWTPRQIDQLSWHQLHMSFSIFFLGFSSDSRECLTFCCRWSPPFPPVVPYGRQRQRPRRPGLHRHGVRGGHERALRAALPDRAQGRVRARAEALLVCGLCLAEMDRWDWHFGGFWCLGMGNGVESWHGLDSLEMGCRWEYRLYDDIVYVKLIWDDMSWLKYQVSKAR